MSQDYQIHISDETDDPEWDTFVAGVPGGWHVQTSSWAQVKALLGWKVFRAVVRQERIVAGAQVLIRPLPLIGSLGYVSRGPLVTTNDFDLLELVIQGLHQVCREHRVQSMAVRPPPSYGDGFARQLLKCGFQPSVIGYAGTSTLVIDLSMDLDDILKQMRKKTRQYIRRSHREGITVREGTEDDLSTFYRLHVATSQRGQFTPYSEEYFARLWQEFSKQGHIRLFLAEYENEAVSALLVIPFRDTVLTKTIGWSGRHGHRRPNEAVYWAALTWAKSEGYRYYDFEGIEREGAEAIVRGDPLPAAQKQSWTFFKIGFGGQVLLQPGTYEYVYNTSLRWIYSKVVPFVRDWPVVSTVLERIRVQ